MKTAKKNFKRNISKIRVDDILDDDPDNPYWDMCAKTPQYKRLKQEISRSIEQDKDHKKPNRKNLKDDSSEDDFLPQSGPKV